MNIHELQSDPESYLDECLNEMKLISCWVILGSKAATRPRLAQIWNPSQHEREPISNTVSLSTRSTSQPCLAMVFLKVQRRGHVGREQPCLWLMRRQSRVASVVR